MSDAKQILDAVHGYISVPDAFAEKIVNTAIFQRLQYISQSAIKSVFPSANHNRYMHSLGVFHIGQMIVNHLSVRPSGIKKERWETVQHSYLLACLLHDVGHAPFSHTFENYFLQASNLVDGLSKYFVNTNFRKDLINPKNPKPHEYASAIVVCRDFQKEIEDLGGDLELVCRMIIGNEYSDVDYSYENCYISLLHGDIVDADRLDYACRDVWTIGYSTATIDVVRLISALRIEKSNEKYIVCFESSVINEIESLMTIKEYQSNNIFSHRMIVYEQYLLVQAAELMAVHLLNAKAEDGASKLKDIIHIDAISPIGREVIKDKMHVALLSDSEVVTYLKRDKDNSYAQELFSRDYMYFALWKTRDEFYHYCPNLKNNSLGSKQQFKGALEPLLQKEGINDFRIGDVHYSHKHSLDKLTLRLSNGEIVKYSNLNRPLFVDNTAEGFFYCYVSKVYCEKLKSTKEKERFRAKIMKHISKDLEKEIIKFAI